MLNNECIKAFMAGAMDSDGCISIKNAVKNNKEYKIAHAEFLISNSETANKNFILALRRLDCYAKFIEKSPINRIRITGREDIETLMESIKDYSVKIKDIPERKSDISSISNKLPLDIVAQIAQSLLGDCKNTSKLVSDGISSLMYNYIHKKRQPSRNGLDKLSSNLNVNALVKERINILMQRDFFIDKIIDIKEEDYSGYVYDLFIPDKHNFICEGVVVHNCIDEMDKMDPQDRSAMHEALEQQSVTISKANIQATLRAETSVLAAANPKFGRFDPYQTVASQIEMPPTLINRFDVIFIIKDNPDRGNDEAIAEHVLGEHAKEIIRDTIDRELFRKYVSYAKQRVHPKLTPESVEEIKKFYVNLRNAPTSGDSPSKPLPISARQLEALVRMSQASAKSRLSQKVLKQDAMVAINLMKYYLMQVGYDYETKTFDIDRIATGVSSSQRGKIMLVKDTIAQLESRLGKMIPIEELKKELQGKIQESEIDESIDKLTIAGDIFHPRKGHVQRM